MTVKELSAQLGVSEQAIRQRCSKAGIEIETVKVGKAAHMLTQVENSIRKLYSYRTDGQAEIIQSEQMKQQIADLLKQVAMLSAQLETVQRKADSLNQSKQKADEQIASLTEQLEAARHECDEKSRQCCHLAEDRESADQENEKLKTKLAGMEQAAAVWQARAEERQTQLDQVNQLASNLTALLPAATTPAPSAPRRSVRQWFSDTFTKVSK